MMVTPEAMQKMWDDNVAMQRTLYDGLDRYVINANTYCGDYNPDTQYITMNIVEYPVDGVKQAFQNMYDGTTPKGTLPTNTTYWICRTTDGASTLMANHKTATSNQHVATAVSVSDSNGFFNSTNVEDALQEIESIHIKEKTGYGVVSGLGVIAQSTPNMTVNASAGVMYTSNGVRFTPNSAILTVPTADSALARTDIAYVNSSGVASYLAGTPAIAGARTYRLTTNAVVGDTFTLLGQTFTATASTTNSTHFAVGSIKDTASNIFSAVSSNANITSIYNILVYGNNVGITLTEKNAGGGHTPSTATYTGTMVFVSDSATTSVSAIPAVTPSDGFQLAQINVPANVIAITNDMIIDRRKMLMSGIASIKTNSSQFTIASTAWVDGDVHVGGYVAYVSLTPRIAPINENSYFIFKPMFSSFQDDLAFKTFKNWAYISDITAADSPTGISMFIFYAIKPLDIDITVYYKEVL